MTDPLQSLLVPPPPPTALAAALLEEWLRPGRIGTPNQSSDAAALSLPPLANLEAALSISRCMATSAHPSVADKRRQLGGCVGWKLGWKNAFAERPILCGPLFGCGIIPSMSATGSTIRAEASLSHHRSFCAEAEFAMILRHPLHPPPPLNTPTHPYTQQQVWNAIDHVELCIELCGARQFASTEPLHYVADALCSSAVVTGPSVGTREDIGDPTSLLRHTVRLSVNDAPISSGDATNNPGDSPLASVTALVNELCVERGLTLEAGTRIICGHCCQAQFDGRPSPPLGGTPRKEWGRARWTDGDVLRAAFGALGDVEVVLRT